MVIIGLLFLIIFGPNKLPSMARDFGRFVSEARRYKDRFETELVSDEEDEIEAEFASNKEYELEIAIEEGLMTPEEITVDEGARVNLRVISAGPVEFYLHGYDLSVEVGPDDPGELSFDATISGRFEIEDHNSDPHEVLGELLVEPR